MQPIAKATLGRLPCYLEYINSLDVRTVSATKIAEALSLGEVQVRKDLNAVSGKGKPKIGYVTEKLKADIEDTLGCHTASEAIIVGAGKLGLALFGYEGFREFGLEISAAFDKTVEGLNTSFSGKRIYPVSQLSRYCASHDVRIGILTVPDSAAQEVCDSMVKSGITAIWNFSSVALRVPNGILVRQENLALSLAHLNQSNHQNKSGGTHGKQAI